jgi:hypothetical protein
MRLDMQGPDAVSEREPSLGDALAPLGTLALLIRPRAVFSHAGPAPSVLHGVTGFRIEKTQPARPEERP